MIENVEALEVYNSVLPFVGEDLTLPSNLAWIFKVEGVEDEVEIFEKVKILHTIKRRYEIQKFNESLKTPKRNKHG